MKSGLIFANASAKAKEENLFSEERLARMLECTSLENAVKILVEANYGGGTVVESAFDFERILGAEYALVDTFVRGAAPQGAGFECFWLKADYHNIKALVKAKYGGEIGENVLLEGGLIPISELKDKLASEDVRLNPYVDAALKEIKKECEVKPSPRLIDTAIDRAMYKDIAARLAEKGTDEHVSRYFKANIDCLNLASFVRSQKIGAQYSFFLSNYIEGGSLAEADFRNAYADGAKFAAMVKKTPFAEYAERLLSGAELAEFEVTRDNYLLNIFRLDRANMFTIAPIMGYYLAKMNEIKVLRIVLVCIKNGVDRAEIKKRLRCMYA